jgi:hypothetical protein
MLNTTPWSPMAKPNFGVRQHVERSFLAHVRAACPTGRSMTLMCLWGWLLSGLHCLLA